MSNKSTNSPRRLRLPRRALAAFTVASALTLLPVVPAFAVNVNTFESPVVQNFNTMTPASATASLPTDIRADNNLAERTLGSYASAATATTLTASQPATNAANGIYNFGSGANNNGTDRAVGFISANSVGGTKSGNLYAKYTNTTGSPLSTIRVSYDVEKYRNGSNSAGYRMQMSYSTDGATWTSAGAGYLTSFAADANNNSCNPAPCSTTPVAPGLLTIPTTANNSDFYLAWNYSVISGTNTGNAQGLAVDNISVAAVGGPLGATGVKTNDVQGTDDGGYAMALQPDGRIVVGGYAVDLANGDKEFALVRYNYDGSLDTTFGGGTGKVVTDFNGTSDRIWGITLQPDGKIVAAGETVSAVFPGTNDIAVARYTTAGVLDTTFGGTGKVTTDHGLGANNAANAVTMSGTNIVVAGYETVSGNNDFMVARYTSAGVLDPTFGTLGVTTTGFSGFSDVARAVALDSTGRIVLGGHANNGTDDDFALARYTAGGVLDAAFVAGAGKVALDIFGSSADQAFALVVNQADNSVVLAGSAYNNGTGNKDFALARYSSTGALQGTTTTDFGNSPDVAQALVRQSDGKMVAAGFSRYSTSSDDFALARYNADGTPDTTFDGDGKLTMRISNADERAYGVAQDFEGKLVCAGFAAVPGASPVTRNFALARFNSNGTLDATSAPSLNSADLLVTVTGPENPNSVVAGGSFTWNVSVSNRGGAPATNVVLTDTLPAGVGYVGSTASNGTANESGGVITNNVGTLMPGTTATLAINVTAGNTPMLVADTAAATLTETDDTPTNNTAT
ncbi:MAG TPA: hypothetical protein VKB12_00905, partial [Pyrinomonadaceae bacterium]|nr:hypothetical protein [Pyrinomonadaceae bacterium]